MKVHRLPKCPSSRELSSQSGSQEEPFRSPPAPARFHLPTSCPAWAKSFLASRRSMHPEQCMANVQIRALAIHLFVGLSESGMLRRRRSSASKSEGFSEPKEQGMRVSKQKRNLHLLRAIPTLMEAPMRFCWRRTEEEQPYANLTAGEAEQKEQRLGLWRSV